MCMIRLLLVSGGGWIWMVMFRFLLIIFMCWLVVFRCSEIFGCLVRKLVSIIFMCVCRMVIGIVMCIVLCGLVCDRVIVFFVVLVLISIVL